MSKVEEDNEAPKPEVMLVAEGKSTAAQHGADSEANVFFKSAEWSADGTSIFASASDNSIHAFVLPDDLLQSKDTALDLTSQGHLALPEPTAAIAPAPYYALTQPSTHAVLVACADHPIQLRSLSLSPTLIPPSERSSPSTSILASYPLINPATEAYLTPRSLLWPSPGTHFLTGTQNLISLFDITRPGADGPITRIQTIPSTRHIAKGNGVGMRGTVAGMSLQPTSTGPTSPGESDGYAAAAATAAADLGRGGLLAAGTWTRHVGLYDLSSPPANACVATWSVASAADDLSEGGKIGGKGIVQTLWSPCGRYLLVNERRSRGLLVYDIRVNGKLLGSLTGRNADTNQRLSCAVYASTGGSTQGGFEVWAGDMHGRAHVWETVGLHEGPQQPIWGWNAHIQAIGAVAMHASGSVVASCSGCWEIDDPTAGDANSQPSLRIWSIGSSACG